MTLRRMFYGMLLGYAVGFVLVLGLGWPQVWWSALGGVAAIAGGLSAAGVPRMLKRKRCPLCVWHRGPESQCTFDEHHEGPCSFEDVATL
jgi:hypothetical protein